MPNLVQILSRLWPCIRNKGTFSFICTLSGKKSPLFLPLTLPNTDHYFQNFFNDRLSSVRTCRFWSTAVQWRGGRIGGECINKWYGPMDCFFWATRFLFSFFPYIFVSVPCASSSAFERTLIYGIIYRNELTFYHTVPEIKVNKILCEGSHSAHLIRCSCMMMYSFIFDFVGH